MNRRSFFTMLSGLFFVPKRKTVEPSLDWQTVQTARNEWSKAIDRLVKFWDNPIDEGFTLELLNESGKCVAVAERQPFSNHTFVIGEHKELVKTTLRLGEFCCPLGKSVGDKLFPHEFTRRTSFYSNEQIEAARKQWKA